MTISIRRTGVASSFSASSETRLGSRSLYYATLLAALLAIALPRPLLPLVSAEEAVDHDPPTEAELPIELVKDNFTDYLLTVPTSEWVVMEFYAHWCPHCIHFKPDFEKISQFFARHNKVPRVVVARVDCADEGALCATFNVKGYPTLRIARPQEFAALDPQLTKTVDPPHRKPKDIVDWIGNYLNITYEDELWERRAYKPSHVVEAVPHAVSQKYDGAHLVRSEPIHPDPSQVDLRDVESSTVLSMRYIQDSGPLLRGVDKRQALHDWLSLLANAHPSDRCRRGSALMLKQFASAWPPEKAAPDAALLTLPVCGKHTHVKADQWQQCKGSLPTSRGYTCGLWLLFHSLAARVPDHMGGALWITGVHGYVAQFFACDQCREHFLAMAKDMDAGAVRSRRDAVLWMWEAHNKVNKRLSAEELQWGDRDPEYPKLQWPSRSLCPRCSLQEGATAGGQLYELMWNEDEVYDFLVAYYGPEAIPQQQAGRRWLGSWGSSRGGQRRHGWLPKLMVLAAVAGLLLRIFCSSPVAPRSAVATAYASVRRASGNSKGLLPTAWVLPAATQKKL